jgi:hypothetical protein
MNVKSHEANMRLRNVVIVNIILLAHTTTLEISTMMVSPTLMLLECIAILNHVFDVGEVVWTAMTHTAVQKCPALGQEKLVYLHQVVALID